MHFWSRHNRRQEHENNDIQDVIFEHSVNCPKPAPHQGPGGGIQPRTQRGYTVSVSLSRLERQLGYTFKDQELMVLALTHRSFAGRNNERLEFLGDAILNFVAGEALFDRFPLAREGQLSRLRARLVKGETLAVLARGFDLGEYLRLGSGELKSGGFRRESILADALEALIGAIYLDAGMDMARERVLAWLAGEFEGLTLVDTNKDPKTRLQEFLQSRGCELPRYEVVDIQGEPHCRTFFVECEITLLNEKSRGQGVSRRIAEQVAAAAALIALGVENGHD
jgi:ribonuclease III, bacterial